MEVYVITKNKGKILAAQSVFSKFGIEVKNIEKDYPEIQANTSLEVAKHTALQAAKEFNFPVVREDHSLFIAALGGFPGPYTNYFDKTIPAEKILELMKNSEDRTAYMEVAAAYAKPNGEVKEYVFRVPLLVSKEIKGNVRNWDRILMIKGTNKTFAESAEEDNIGVWDKNYINVAESIVKENNKSKD